MSTRDPNQLAEGVALTRQMGMTGKLALRSSDAEAINVGLSPSDSDIGWAQEFVELFEGGGGKPKDGSDLTRLNRARTILERARQLGLISSSKARAVRHEDLR